VFFSKNFKKFLNCEFSININAVFHLKFCHLLFAQTLDFLRKKEYHSNNISGKEDGR